MLVPFDEESEKRTYTLLMPGITVFIITEMYLIMNLNSIQKVTIVLGKNVSSKESFQFTLGNLII